FEGAKPLQKKSSPSLTREGDKGGRLLSNIQTAKGGGLRG
ncbi:unnamed protein product, partial [marine sediment metagenome]